MKILAAGDIHGDTKLVEQLATKAEEEKVDLVILCGDLTLHESATDNIIGPFVKKNLKVALIPGNHETPATADFLSQLYGVTNLHGYSKIVGDVGFFGCGGANIGLCQLTEDEIIKTLGQAHDKVKDKKKKVMVTHVHPAGTLMAKLTRIFPGSIGIAEAVKKFKPDVLLCSHVHEAEGIEETLHNTKVINVGKHGKIIEF